MNQDIAQGNWKQLSGKIRQKWGKLTDDDLTRAKGDKEYLVGKLHEQYGLAKDRVEDELQTLGYREDDQDVDLRSSGRSAAGRMDAAGYSDAELQDDAGSSRQDREGGAGHTLEAAGSGQDSSSNRSSTGSNKPGSKAGRPMPDKASPQKGNRNNPGGSSSRS
jgi:uncharacterized protein YjbJ (UPF0337 family)